MSAAPTIPAGIRTPAYVLDMARLDANLATAARLKRETGCTLLLATKAFAFTAAFPRMRAVLDGSTASGLYEARMGRADFGKEVHVYSPAYTEAELTELTGIARHIYFNSPAQLRRFLPIVRRTPGIHVGLRVNPGYSMATLGGPLYDPCAPGSRFGATRDTLDAAPWDDIDILHVHALCEATADGSVGLIEHVGRELGVYVRKVKAVNFGGGHFLNRAPYDIGRLIAALNAFKSEFGVEVILEPGAGLIVDTGYLVATVLDLHRNGEDIAILDASASCHMPDVLEVPYTPPVYGAVASPDVSAKHRYILAGNTCMTGDIIGTYAFERALKPGDRIIFGDMMQYSFVKNNTFNGQPLPDLAVLDTDGNYRVVKSYGYDAFRERLG
ncbi:MAG: carboxynorspermidine decarboxylase [Hyphomicrobiaceae bacterium]|nr:carboxynorspermidine decarboxylase [Hyphomicrobiaceae bacterium]